MKTIHATIWGPGYDAYIIPVCGSVDSKRELVMKDTVGVQVKRKYPMFPGEFGKLVSLYGNKPYVLTMGKEEPRTFITLPTRRFWNEPDWEVLVKISLRGVISIMDARCLHSAIIPKWTDENWDDWQYLLENTLDDRFVLVTY